MAQRIEPSPNAKARLRSSVRVAIAAAVKSGGVPGVASRLGATEESVERWVRGDWPSYPNAVRFAPILGVPS